MKLACLILLAAALEPASVLAAPCAFDVRLNAERAIAASMIGALERRGLRVGTASTADPGCAELDTVIREEQGALAVALLDGRGRRAERRLSDPEVAAAWIESWAPGQIGALLGPEPASEPRRVIAGSAEPTATLEAPIPLDAPSRVALSLLGEGSLGSDGSSWIGAAVSGCSIVWGPLCAGIRAAIARNAGFGDDGIHSAADRLELKAMLALSWREVLAAGPVSLGMDLGLGLGWLRTSRGDTRAAACDSAGDSRLGACAPRIADGFSTNHLGPRAGLGAELAFSFGRFAPKLRVGVELAPLARTERALPGYADALPLATREPLALSAEPLLRFGLALGGELELP